MNTNRAILIGIVAGVITATTVLASDEIFTAEAQMGGMMGGGSSGGGMSHGSDSGSSGGMMGGGGPSRHGVWYGPGTVHQQCHMGGDMPPHYCEPYYKAMSSVVGVKISNVDPIDEKTIKVTLKEISIATPGINQKITVSAGTVNLVGTAVVDGGWSGTTSVNVPLTGLGHIYTHQSMNVHIFPVTNG
jgi:hypothetical protein